MVSKLVLLIVLGIVAMVFKNAVDSNHNQLRNDGNISVGSDGEFTESNPVVDMPPVVQDARRTPKVHRDYQYDITSFVTVSDVTARSKLSVRSKDRDMFLWVAKVTAVQKDSVGIVSSLRVFWYEMEKSITETELTGTFYNSYGVESMSKTRGHGKKKRRKRSKP